MQFTDADGTLLQGTKVRLEDEKGNMLNHEVFPMLKSAKGINFVGNLEAREILSGDVDVVVADGFSGNVAVKAIEGGIKTIMKLLKQGIYSSFKGKIAGLLLKDTFKEISSKLDYNNHGGALFVGVNKTVIKAHGSSDAKSIETCIKQAKKYHLSNVAEIIAENKN